MVEELYVYLLAKFTGADAKFELKENIKVKSYLKEEFKKDKWEYWYDNYCELIKKEFDNKKYLELLDEVEKQKLLTYSDKKRFLYNLAGIAKSKNTSSEKRISDLDYKAIINIAEDLKIDIVSADSVIESVFGITETFIGIIGVFCIGATLFFTKTLFIPLFLAFFLSRVIKKGGEILSRSAFNNKVKGLSDFISFILVYAVIIFILIAGIIATTNTINDLPKYKEKFVTLLDQTITKISKITDIGIKGSGDALKKIDELPVLNLVKPFFSGLMNAFSVFGYFLLIIILSAYFVFGKLGSTSSEMEEIDSKLTSYVSVKFVVSILTSISFYLILELFGLDFAVFWAFLAFIFNFIPAIGSILATAFPALFALLVFSPVKVLILVIILTIIENFVGNYLEPVLFGKKMELKPITVMWGLMLWGIIWGIPGMFLSAPLMALLKIIGENYTFSKKISKYL